MSKQQVKCNAKTCLGNHPLHEFSPTCQHGKAHDKDALCTEEICKYFPDAKCVPVKNKRISASKK